MNKRRRYQAKRRRKAKQTAQRLTLHLSPANELALVEAWLSPPEPNSRLREAARTALGF